MSKTKKIVSIIAVILIVSSFLIIPVSSASYPSEFYVPISQPTPIDNNGYIEILASDVRGNQFVEVVIFNVIATVTSGEDNQVMDTYSVVNFTEHNVSIMGFVDNANGHHDISIGAFIVNNAGTIFTYNSSDNSLSIPYGSTILSVRVYGDASIGSIPSSFSNNSFIVGYGTDYTSVRSLYDISAFLNNDLLDFQDALSEDMDSISFSLNSISQDIYDLRQELSQNSRDQMQNDDKNAQAIQDNQDKNTQAQIDADNERAENEKNEIQNSGDTAVDGQDALPNQSEGFIQSLGNLVNAMSYNGTECKWTFPEVKMPQIGNIVPEMTLIEEQDIDFGYWIQKIPNNILQLVRNLLTITLVVFCFKELYSTISYVLTLKGGGN